MSYRLKRAESVSDGVRRVGREQAQAALAAAVASDRPVEGRVHEARKCCKKLRGALRLVRPHLGERYAVENGFIRDTARRLSASRDAAVVLAAFDGVAKKHVGEPTAIDGVRQALVDRLFETREADEASPRLATFADDMRELLERIDEWSVDADGFDAVGDGLRRSYRDGRKAMQTALKSADVLDWHEWRKRVKDHWYHVRLLRDVWKPVMKAREKELKALSDLLGEDHDLAVLHGAIADLTDATSEAAASLLAAVSRWRDKRQTAARVLGRRIYAETPKALQKRLRRYWKVWQQADSPASV